MTATINLPNNKRRRLAQVGLTARGLLYCLVGLLALQIAFGGGDGQASQSGALQTLAKQPFGKALVALVGLGLVAYALWRFAQFFTEKGSEDSDTENAVMRISYIVRGVIYVALAFTAFKTAFGGGGGGSSNQGMAASVMKNVPGGVVLVGLVGLIVIGVACYQGYKAFSDDFMEELRQGEMDQRVRTWTRRIGVAGHSARAVVYTLIGIFIIRAAVQFDADEAKGLDGALQELSQQAYGVWLLVLVALGLFLFGIYTLVRARYVDVSE